MTKQFRLYQFGGDSSHINSYKLFVFTTGVVMNSLGHKLFSSSGFTRNTYRNIRFSSFLDTFKYFIQGFTFANDGIFKIIFFLNFFTQGFDFAQHANSISNVANGVQQALFDVAGFHNIIVGTEFQQINDRINIALLTNHDYFNIRIFRFYHLKDF